MQQKRPYTYKGSRRKARRQKLTGLIVMAVLVVIMLVLALLLGNGAKGEGEASSAASAPSNPSADSGSMQVVVPPVSSAPAVSVPSSSEPEPPPGPYDEAGIPPLYNATHFIPEDNVVDHLDVGGGQTMDRRAGEAFLAMRAAAAADGVDLAPVSGYRSHERQTTNFNNAIQRYLNEGYSQEEAERRTKRYYAIPGTSEHEAGLAMDIGWIDDSFENSAAFTWLQEHCNEYGFIFRYRKDTEDITGIAYEPWHYRYVGANHAIAIEEKGVTLEEYVQELENSQRLG